LIGFTQIQRFDKSKKAIYTIIENQKRFYKLMATNALQLLAAERQQIILEILEQEAAVRTSDLCELLKVSVVTIRSDLRDIEKAGLCQVVWGGAVAKTPPTEPPKMEQRSKINTESKLNDC